MTTRAVLTLWAVLALSGCPDDPSPNPRPEPVEPTEEPDPQQPEVKPEFRLTSECRLPTPDEIKEDRVVEWAMRDRLRETLVGKERPYVEEGGWVYQCEAAGPGGGTSYYLDVALVEGGPRAGPGIDMQDATYLAHMPGRPECRTVGVFHTHPSHGDLQREPSPNDKTNLARRGIPSFIVKPTEATQGYPVGYERLPDLEVIPYGDWADAGTRNLSWTCDAGSCPVAEDAEASSQADGLDPCSCYWSADMSGAVRRSLKGRAVNVGRLQIDEGRAVTTIGLSQAPGSEETDGLSFFLSEDLAERDFLLGPRQVNGAGLGTREVPFSFAATGGLRITLHEPDVMVVGGFALGYGGLTLPDFESAELEIRGEFVWTPACPTAMEQLLDIGKRTAEVVERLQAEGKLP